MILSTPAEIAEGLRIFLSENSLQKQKDLPEFEKDRLSKTEAAKLAGISIPTLSKFVLLGKFKEYSIGRRKYFLRSEIIAALRNSTQ